MSDKKDPTETTSEDTARAAATIWELILLCMGSFTIKTIWNLSVKRMFPSIPIMYFLDGVGLLVIVYILARTASAGFMTESMRTLARGLATASAFFKGIAEELGVNKFKVNVHRNEQEESDSDLN